MRLSLALLCFTRFVLAQPLGLEVIHGDALCHLLDVNTLEIVTGAEAILQWDSFCIEENETVRFVMPDAGGRVLNRVLGGDTSKLLGKLDVNGDVYLVNPEGILIGTHGCVDAVSFTASGFDMSDEHFFQRKNRFRYTFGGDVIHQGMITARGGDVHLIGSALENIGEIQALKLLEKGGRIVLTAESGLVELQGKISADASLSCEGENVHISNGAQISAVSSLLISGNDDIEVEGKGDKVVIETTSGSLFLSSNEGILITDTLISSAADVRIIAGGSFELLSNQDSSRIAAATDLFIEADTMNVDGEIVVVSGNLDVLTCDLILYPNSLIELSRGEGFYRIMVDDGGKLNLLNGAVLRSCSSGFMSLFADGGIFAELGAAIYAPEDVDIFSGDGVVFNFEKVVKRRLLHFNHRAR
jgi:filamentous hemagglutinin family protein